MDSYDGDHSDLQQEIEVLQEIYINELQLDRDTRGHVGSISLQLHPATGDQVDKKWVCLTLVLKPSSLYPDEVPQIHIKNPRGLSEEYVIRLQNNLDKLAEDKRGECMLFELIELAKDTLTQGNLPYGECVICKDGFSEKEHFTKTQCYHYFHCHCLLRYIKYSEQEIDEEYEAALRISPHVKVEKKKVVCPVCREPLIYDLAQLQKHPEPDDLDPCSIIISPDVRQIQKQMCALFKKQQSKGGIIDLQAEKDKYLVPSSLSTSLGIMINGSTAVTDDCSKEVYEAKETSEDSDLVSLKGENGNYTAEGWNTSSITTPNEVLHSGESLQETADEKTSKPVIVFDNLSRPSFNSIDSIKYNDRTKYRGKNSNRQPGFMFRNSNRSRPRGQGQRNYYDNYERNNTDDKKTRNKSKQLITGHCDISTDEGRGKTDDETGDTLHYDEVDDKLDACSTDKRVNYTQNRYPGSQRKKVYHERWRVERSYHGKKHADHIDTEGDVGEGCDGGTSDVASVTVRPKAGEVHMEIGNVRRYGTPARGGYGRSRKRFQQNERTDYREDKSAAVTSNNEVECSETASQSNCEQPAQHKIQSKGLPASSGSSEYNQMRGPRSGRGSRNRFRQQRPSSSQIDGSMEGEDARGQYGYNENISVRNQTSSQKSHKQHNPSEEKDRVIVDSSHQSSRHHKGFVNRTFSRSQYRGDSSHGHYHHHHHHGGYRKHDQKYNSQSNPADDKSFDSKDAVS